MEQEFERAMAFAGVLQAIVQVQALARDGEIESTSLASCLQSILVTNPESPKDVYGEQPDLKLGYESILNQLSDGSKKDVEATRYLVGILALERKLSHSDSALGMLAERFTQVQRQLHHFDITDEQVIANFASIYSDVISPLGHKIQISGNPLHLQRPIVQQRIRALLLSAIRSAVLWRQLGGKRRHLVFSRKAIVDVAKKALPYNKI